MNLIATPVVDRPSSPLGAPEPGSGRAGGALRPAEVVRIRPIRPADQIALRAFYAGLSEESRRTRFFGPTAGIGPVQSTWFCTPDHDHREGFVAVSPADDERERIVGHVCIEPDGPASAEVAVAVADTHRARGLGRLLVETAVAWARTEGLHVLTATMLAGNPAIQRLLTGLGLPSVTRPAGAGVIEIRLDVSAVRTT